MPGGEKPLTSGAQDSGGPSEDRSARPPASRGRPGRASFPRKQWWLGPPRLSAPPECGGAPGRGGHSSQSRVTTDPTPASGSRLPSPPPPPSTTCRPEGAEARPPTPDFFLFYFIFCWFQAFFCLSERKQTRSLQPGPQPRLHRQRGPGAVGGSAVCVRGGTRFA